MNLSPNANLSMLFNFGCAIQVARKFASGLRLMQSHRDQVKGLHHYPYIGTTCGDMYAGQLLNWSLTNIGHHQ